MAFTLFLVGIAACASGYVPEPVVFDTPSANEKGIMVLGNGEVGATAWIGADGTLHTVLQNSDSWNEGGRHVKTGAIDYETKSPVDAGTYRQELSMERGEFEATWKSGGRAVSLRYRIQQGTDSIAVCDVKGAPGVEAKVVNWRLYPGGAKVFGIGEYELGNRFCEGGPYGRVLSNKKFTISADRLVPGGWCHVNRNETVAELMKVYDYYQATGDLGKPDLLSNRAFGGLTRKYCGAARRDASPHHTLFLTAITCYHPCKDEAEWLRRTNEMLDRDGWTPDGEEAKRAEHIAWWRAFWNRSHIAVTPSKKALSAPPKPYDFPTNSKLPLSFGVDSKGDNKFLGTFASAEVEFGGKVVYSGVPKAREVVDLRCGCGNAASALRDGEGAAATSGRDAHAFRFACTFTTDHLEKPQRLFDNMTPGGSDGFIIDVYLGRPRAIFGNVQMHHSSKIEAGRETTLEVRVSKSGTAVMTVNGKTERKSLVRPRVSLADECRAITTAYSAQRYLTACASRGRLPIRFNGTLFTISHRGDPDYRRWGNGYWWQNTRLPYYPMFAAGDIDGTDALFDMYFGKLEFLKKRTKKYFGHDGAFFPECMQPWGDHFMGCYGPECEWKYRKDKHQYHPCHKYAWVGQLELSLMAIMRWQYTQDGEWFKKNALPSIREYVRYFDGHFKLDAKGRYHMYPAQAVETWQDCTNPMTEVAGLTRVTDLMLAMPADVLSADDRTFFAKIRSRLPELPTRTLKNGGVVFAPAERFERHGNVETPELYCVFPFRLSSFEKPNAEIGRRTYTDGRFHKLYFGWAQDELNAAYLGMAEEAREHIVERATMHTPTLNRVIGCNEERIAERGLIPSEYRWPAYWGPNFNWCPDQDEGGVFQNTIQSMLMQYEGERIFLMPAWPVEWDCDFKLNAPRNTTVEGRIENGELKNLVVTPASRRGDVVAVSAFPTAHTAKKCACLLRVRDDTLMATKFVSGL